MCKTDIKKAFRIVPIVPQEHYLLGFNVNGLYCSWALNLAMKCMKLSVQGLNCYIRLVDI